MDLSRLLLPGLAVLLILAVLPVLRAAPLRQITRAGANSLLGLGALLLVNLTAPLTGAEAQDLAVRLGARALLPVFG